MRIYLRLSGEGAANVRDRLRSRIAFGGQVWEAFAGHLYPSSVEFWKNATPPELDGQLIPAPLELDGREPISSLVITIDALANKLSLDDLLYSIILIKGIWHIGDRSLIGHISINNAPNWKKMYQDVEVDGETRVEGEDFADIVLQSLEMGEPFVRQFVKKMSETAKLSATYFFDGPASRAEIYNAKSIYYPTLKEYVTDALYSYRTELTEKEEHVELAHLSPYSQSFLVASLMQNLAFERRLRANLEQSQIIEVPTNSVFYLGKKKDSFREAYERLKKDAFEKIATKLRPAEIVSREIRDSLGDYTQDRLNKP